MKANLKFVFGRGTGVRANPSSIRALNEQNHRAGYFYVLLSVLLLLQAGLAYSLYAMTEGEKFKRARAFFSKSKNAIMHFHFPHIKSRL